ncbi:hypothetical protein DV515_00007391 [Chloebia gouldiae]|uniref:Uncharacterized protein n=1 Tax=Chloebia gouldiae TaxID=44316 RepID=A0A3L8SHL5_CHLGU|nr:hypothetical protein DV515_00007391 [Chloebia gouldiae]
MQQQKSLVTSLSRSIGNLRKAEFLSPPTRWKANSTMSNSKESARWLDSIAAQPLVRTGTQEFRKNFLAEKSCGNSLPGFSL